MPDTSDSWNDRHKWNNRQNQSRSVHVCLLYRVAKKSSHVHALAEKLFRKCQLIWATAMESILRKGSFLQLLNVLWKRTLPQLLFYTATLRLKISSPWKSLFHSWIRRDFSFDYELMIWKYIQMHKEDCRCAAWLVSTRVIKNISLWPISGIGSNIFLLDRKRKKTEKNNSEVSVKYLTVFSRISTLGTH